MFVFLEPLIPLVSIVDATDLVCDVAKFSTYYNSQTQLLSKDLIAIEEIAITLSYFIVYSKAMQWGWAK